MSKITAFATLLTLTAVSAAKPANPIRVNTTATEFLGREKNWPKDNILRDGGAEGVLANHYYQIYADTCIGYQNDTGCTGFPIAGNTIASQTFDPTISQNFADPPTVFCSPANGARTRLSSMVPINNTHSALWYVSIKGCDGQPIIESNGCPDQSGVAIAQSTNGQPSCVVGPGLWDVRHEPQWGNTAAIGPLLDGRFYLYASLDVNAPYGNKSSVYMARVYPNQVNNVNAYEYWNGQAFTSQRLIDPATATSDPAAILQGVSVGSAFYSPFYKRYVVLSAPGGNSIAAYTAVSPEGPYSDPVTLWSNSSYGGYANLYSPAAITALDTSGKTLIVNLSYTAWNAVSVILRLHFL